MKKLLTIITFLICTAPSFGQSARELFFSPGISYQKQFLGEFNLMVGNHIVERGAGDGGLRIGLQSNFNTDNLIVAPKASIELAFVFVCVRLGSVCYFNKSVIDLRVLPEIGLSYLGILNLTYGYGIPILKDRVSDISKSMITLTLNYNLAMWRDYNFIVHQ